MTMEGRVSKHPLARYGAVLGICGLAGAGGGLVVGIVTASSPQDGPARAAIIAAAVTLAMAAGLWACLRWWRGLDEAAQEAHKWAWWWGSTVGLAFAGVVLLTLIYGAAEVFDGPAKPLFMAGAALVVGFQTLGYGIAWGLWWLKRR